MVNLKYDKYMLDLYNVYVSKHKFTWTYLLKHYINIYNYMLKRYNYEKRTKNIGEIIYRIYNHLNVHPVCPVCGKLVLYVDKNIGYKVFCSLVCRYSLKGKKLYTDKIKNTCLERYGCENPFLNDLVKKKIIETNIERYGCAHVLNNEAIRQKTIETNMKRYGVPVSSLNDEVKKKLVLTNMKRYGVPYTTMWDVLKEKTKLNNIKKYGIAYTLLTDEVKKKSYETMKKNHSFTTSKIEEQFAIYLDKCGLKYKRQYKSDLYPFRCDFYLIDYDVYIEIQGHWHHGYNNKTKKYIKYGESNLESKILLLQWLLKANEGSLLYKDAINVWTIRDVIKRLTAYNNHLKYYEYFTNKIDVLIELFNKDIKRNF